MDRELTNLRRELTHIERGRGRRYPAALRDRVARWTLAHRSGGASWQDIAAELEIAVETLKRWTAIGDVAISAGPGAQRSPVVSVEHGPTAAPAGPTAAQLERIRPVFRARSADRGPPLLAGDGARRASPDPGISTDPRRSLI